MNKYQHLWTMLILRLHKFGMLSIVGADLESYTYYQRSFFVLPFSRSPVLSHSRFSHRSVTWSFCRMVVLSHGRSVAWSFCRIVVLSEHSLRFSEFSWILGFLDSRPLVLSSSRPLVPHVVLSDSRILAAFSQILGFLSSCPIVPCVILSHCRSL